MQTLLVANPKGRSGKTAPATNIAGELEDFLKTFAFTVDVVACHAGLRLLHARRVLGIFELPRFLAAQDWDPWRPLTRWIARARTTSNG